MQHSSFDLELINILKLGPSLSQGIACILLLKGEVDIVIDGGTYQMKEDDLVVINHNQVYSVRSGDNSLLLLLRVDEEHLQKECGALAANRLLCNGAAENMAGDGTYFELKRVLVNLFNVKLDKPYGYNLNLNMNLLRFLHLLYTTYSQTDAPAPAPGPDGAEKPDQKDILQYIHKNCRRALTLQETAAHFYLSPAYFSKYFKKITGVGYLQYLQKVRVEKSLPRLLYSDDSVLQIAVDHGFANPKAYTDNFVRCYGETPSAFRKRQQTGGQRKALAEKNQVLMDDQLTEDARIEFLRYVKKYEVQSELPQGPVDERHVVQTLRQPLRSLRRMENILLIDEPQTALLYDFPLCMECKDSFNVQYAYFQLLNYYMSEDEYSLLFYHQIIDSVNKIQQCGLFPFIRLDFSKHPFTGADQDILGYLHGRLLPVLKLLKENFSKEKTRRWRFEIVCTSFGPQQAVLFYKTVWNMVVTHFSGSTVGLFADPDREGESTVGERFRSLLSQAKSMSMAPTFVTFHGFQNRLKRRNPVDAVLYSHGEGFHADIAASVMMALNQCGVIAPLYMTAWNTFSGKHAAEINVYVRAGLIMESLMDLCNIVQGVGYRFAKSSVCPYSGEPYGVPLNLFIFSRTKRPVFYVAGMIDRMRGDLLYQTKRVAVVRNGEGELVVTVWNPQPLNPARSLDGPLTNSLTQQIRVELQGLENRRYSIKRFTLDVESNGTITRLQHSGFPDWQDKDVNQHMHDTTGIDLFYFTQEAVDGTLVLSGAVRYNGVVMYVLV